MRTILDASALLAFFLQETGRDVVGSAITGGAAMCVANLAEVASVLARAGVPAATVRANLARLPIAWVPVDIDLALDAGLMEHATRPAGLSLGDRLCLALAAREAAPVLTADRAWTRIAAALGVTVTLIR